MAGGGKIRYLSVCSGIEAASVAWEPLGWEPAGFSEIEPFPCAVLKHRFPNVTNYGDMTKFKEWKNVGAVDVLVGGTPCQSFSTAGLRKGLADPRGNLMLTFGAIAAHFRPRWLIWENVPGVLSSHGGRDFGTFLGMLAELGYGFAYRVLDAQYFGVAQRRRRVFVVGHLGDWRCAAAVLFESESLSGNPPPSRKKGEGFAAEVSPSLTASGRGVERTGGSRGQDPVVACYGIPGNWVNRKPENGGNATAPINDVSPCLTGADRHAVCLMDQGGAIMNVEQNKTGTLRAQMRGHVPIVYDCRGFGDGKTVPTLCTDHPARVSDHCPIVIDGQGGEGASNITIENISPTSCSGGNGNTHAVCMAHGQANAEILCDKCPTLNCNHEQPIVFNAQGSARQGASAGVKQRSYLREDAVVRRLTPRECERLQGFPDNWTRIPYRGKPAEQCPDSPRYKACGNSMAVPVMRWIGERVVKVEKTLNAQALANKRRAEIEP